MTVSPVPAAAGARPSEAAPGWAGECAHRGAQADDAGRRHGHDGYRGPAANTPFGKIGHKDQCWLGGLVRSSSVR